MTGDESAHAAVVYNPVKVDLERLRAAVATEEQRAGWSASHWFETAADDSGRGAARRALAVDPALMIVAGGDGTVTAVADEVRASGIPLGLVAGGTGNLLVRNLGLPVADVAAAVRIAFTGDDRRIDFGRASWQSPDHSSGSQPFLVMAGIGLDAAMALRTNAALKERLGWLAYTDPIGRSVLANRQFPMHYSIDGARRRSVRAHTVIVGNCGTLTANILLLPAARLDDGLLDVVVLRPQRVTGWARVGSRLAIGGILHRSKGGRLLLRGAPGLRALHYAQARRMQVEFNQPQDLELDGDGVGPVVSVAVTVDPAALVVRTR